MSIVFLYGGRVHESACVCAYMPMYEQKDDAKKKSKTVTFLIRYAGLCVVYVACDILLDFVCYYYMLNMHYLHCI